MKFEGTKSYVTTRDLTVAVNAAIIPEYGGSNLGVPAEYARRLLEDADVQYSARR